jgi:hypothetical protein
MIFLYHHGWMPPRVDHQDRDHTNNCIDNLRKLTPGENRVNSEVILSRQGFKGVTKNGRKYVAQIKKDYKNNYLGTFNTPEEAHEAYLAAREELFPGVVR